MPPPKDDTCKPLRHLLKTLLASKKKPIRFLARLNELDLRTVLGRTLHKLTTLVGIDTDKPGELTVSRIKSKLKYFEVPNEEMWRLPMCNDLLDVRQGNLELKGFTADECSDMLRWVCTS